MATVQVTEKNFDTTVQEGIVTDRVRAAETPEQIVLDVRTREEFAAAHVPNAKNIPVQELLGRHAELGAKTTPVVIYCRSGARSAVAADLLKGLGFSQITDIGPMSNWGRG